MLLIMTSDMILLRFPLSSIWHDQMMHTFLHVVWVNTTIIIDTVASATSIVCSSACTNQSFHLIWSQSVVVYSELVDGSSEGSVLQMVSDSGMGGPITREIASTAVRHVTDDSIDEDLCLLGGWIVCSSDVCPFFCKRVKKF